MIPQVVAHRGSNEDEPEHSLASYLRAIEEKADAVECDVRLTADGTLVCVHDRRIDRTSSGRGPVSRHDLGDLMDLDFSRSTEIWHDIEAPPADESRTNVLTLRTLLSTLLDASPTIAFAIETKHPTRYGHYVEEELINTLGHFGLASRRSGDPDPSRVRIMSFSQLAMRRVHCLAPRIPTVLLMERVWRRFRDGSLPDGIPIAGVSIDWVRAHPEYVARVHEQGHRVHVWTVDEPEDVRLCVSLGVEAIISNRPAMVRGVLEAMPGA